MCTHYSDYTKPWVNPLYNGYTWLWWHNALRSVVHWLSVCFQETRSTMTDPTQPNVISPVGCVRSVMCITSHWDHNSRTGHDGIIEQQDLDMLRNEDKFREKIDAVLQGWDINIIIDGSVSYQACVVDIAISIFDGSGFLTCHRRNCGPSSTCQLSSLRPYSMSSIRTRHP